MGGLFSVNRARATADSAARTPPIPLLTTVSETYLTPVAHDQQQQQQQRVTDDSHGKNVSKLPPRMDPCYGPVALFALALELLETHEFMRLNHLKQLGMLSVVLEPASGSIRCAGSRSAPRAWASHTRMEHSIGVAHLAHLVANHFARNRWISRKDIKLVVLAGLCHDLGHITFCHQGDNMLAKLVPDTATPHEVRSQHLAIHILQKYTQLTCEEIDMVAHIIEPTNHMPGSTVDYDSDRSKRLANIINNVHHGMDVDKMDYVMFRDPYHMRLACGDAPLERLESLKAMFHRSYFDQSNVWRFAEEDRHFLRSLREQRSMLYKQYYLHPRMRAVDAMFVDVMRVLQHRGIVDLRKIRSDDVDSWLRMTDDYWSELEVTVQYMQYMQGATCNSQTLALLRVIMDGVTNPHGLRYSVVPPEEQQEAKEREETEEQGINVPSSSSSSSSSVQPQPLGKCLVHYPVGTCCVAVTVRRVGFTNGRCLDPHCGHLHTSALQDVHLSPPKVHRIGTSKRHRSNYSSTLGQPQAHAINSVAAVTFGASSAAAAAATRSSRPTNDLRSPLQVVACSLFVARL